ncbi:MAG: hypothetical protein QXG17_06130 [Sulfolobales archaeon]
MLELAGDCMDETRINWGNSLLEDDLVAAVIKVICGYNTVDPEIIKHEVKVDYSTVERILGALLSSGYLVEVKLNTQLCGSCPFRVACVYPAYKGYSMAYATSEKLKELCKHVADIQSPRS